MLFQQVKFILILSICFLTQSFLFAEGIKTITVATDGSGDYTSIQEAVTACGAFPSQEKVVFVKKGVYHEKILIDSFHTNITLQGEDKENTRIEYGDYAGMPGIGTFNSYTVKVAGENIKIKDITIANTAGEVGQAVALYIEGDRVSVYNCLLLGNQDTLYTGGQKSRQYFKGCDIEGTTDFIFGSATAVFEECKIHCKKNSYITAANTPKEKAFGLVFIKCKLTAASSVDKVYLGRPWRDYARTVYISCEMGAHIRPEGWHNWSKPEREKTAFFAEYNCTGPGANTKNRVSWSHQLTPKEVKEYNLDNMFSFCSSWKIIL